MNSLTLLLGAIGLLIVKSRSMSIVCNKASKAGYHSLGASALRDLVIEAAEYDESTSLDLQGILWLEHINLVVGDKALAEHFYLDFLGLTRDPDAKFHCNLGQQQFHLAETGDPAQKVTGSIGLVVPSLITVRERLKAAEQALSGTEFQVIDDTCEDMLTLRCPWGNTFHIYDTESDLQHPASSSDQKMVKLHAKGGSYAASRMSVRGQPGIRFVEIACPVGSVAAISQFYDTMLLCSTHSPESGSAAVCVGPGVHLLFVESQDVSAEDFDRMKGVHVCIYVAGFLEMYERLLERGLVWTNPRFLHLDCCDSWEDAKASRTLRFKNIIDCSTEQVLLELEHETRPIRHGQFMKCPMYIKR